MAETIVVAFVAAFITVISLRKFAFRHTNDKEYKTDVVMVIALTALYSWIANGIFSQKPTQAPAFQKQEKEAVSIGK